MDPELHVPFASDATLLLRSFSYCAKLPCKSILAYTTMDDEASYMRAPRF